MCVMRLSGWVWWYVCPCAYIQRLDQDERCLPVTFHIIALTHVFRWISSLPFWVGWQARVFRNCPSLPPHAWLLRWVLGIWTEVFIFPGKHSHLLSHLSSPQGFLNDEINTSSRHSSHSSTQTWPEKYPQASVWPASHLSSEMLTSWHLFLNSSEFYKYR